MRLVIPRPDGCAGRYSLRAYRIHLHPVCGTSRGLALGAAASVSRYAPSALLQRSWYLPKDVKHGQA
ncbi:hypothetical protein PHLH8_45190 [Pseudomonas sp. Pc102]|uniref:hypothetical protein n=1 Tax=Pseudomonas sp. Pc102 TaxID=2678261 RepID=UPI001BCEF9DE|nr:hypothetical protein [Pseudomonas sp. Pc102]BBP84877.1 hypothetical protein PHLH8_45190 [Pseudomonas sp. Pc102]